MKTEGEDVTEVYILNLNSTAPRLLMHFFVAVEALGYFLARETIISPSNL